MQSAALAGTFTTSMTFSILIDIHDHHVRAAEAAADAGFSSIRDHSLQLYSVAAVDELFSQG